MTERTLETEPVCHVPGCERPADPETEPFAVCPEHWHVMDALADVDDWALALKVLRTWVETAEVIGFERLTQVMHRVLSEVELEADLARDELERAEAEAAL